MDPWGRPSPWPRRLCASRGCRLDHAGCRLDRARDESSSCPTWVRNELASQKKKKKKKKKKDKKDKKKKDKTVHEKRNRNRAEETHIVSGAHELAGHLATSALRWVVRRPIRRIEEGGKPHVQPRPPAWQPERHEGIGLPLLTPVQNLFCL